MDELRFREWLLVEFPVTKFKKLGRWEPTAPKYGFHADDIGIINSPKGEAKIIKKWSNTKENFELYFVRVPGGFSTLETGEVTPEWVQEKLKVDIQPNLNAITVIFTNNRAAGRVPLTAWTIAHRFGHAIRQTNEYKHFMDMIENDIKQMVGSLYGMNRPDRYLVKANSNYQRVLRVLLSSIGDFKSAREDNIRNEGEFMHELLAQYIITGRITFRQPADKIIMRYAYGHPSSIIYAQNKQDVEAWHAEITAAASRYEDTLDQIMRNLVGRMFVV